MIKYRDTLRTVGALRAAAHRLCTAQRGGKPDIDLAVEVHDSLCRMLEGPSDMSAEEVRAMLRPKGNTGPGDETRAIAAGKDAEARLQAMKDAARACPPTAAPRSFPYAHRTVDGGEWR